MPEHTVKKKIKEADGNPFIEITATYVTRVFEDELLELKTKKMEAFDEDAIVEIDKQLEELKSFKSKK